MNEAYDSQPAPRAVRVIGELIRTLFLVGIFTFAIRVLVLQPNSVEGASMFPNLQDGNRLGVEKISYRFESAQRGDIVIFKYPLDRSIRYVKRVLGLPGETVRLQKGHVFILNKVHPSGFQLDEGAYLASSVLTTVPGSAAVRDFTVPADSYFVMGDNRQFSSDSRQWGYLPSADIEGRALFRMFPLSEMGLFPRQKYLDVLP